MNPGTTRELITDYYAAFNKGHMKTFFSLLTDDVIHDINQSGREIGKETFARFMECMNQNYREQLKDIVVMVNSDESLPPAKGQTYVLPAGAFFEIKNNKVARISNYYNLGDWVKQVSG